MRKFITLLFGVLLGMMPPLLPAQQNQNPQQSDTEVESLEKRVSELEKQLQAAENVEKIDLQAKLADANTKLINAEFGKFERGLKDSNDEWLKGWSSWFLGIFLAIIAIFVALFLGVSRVFWFWLRSKADGLLADTVEKSLDGFKEAVDAQDVIKNELRILKKERAASALEDFMYLPLDEEEYHPERIKILPEEDLLPSEFRGRRLLRIKFAEYVEFGCGGKVEQRLEFRHRVNLGRPFQNVDTLLRGDYGIAVEIRRPLLEFRKILNGF